jgi:hypothetical protein
MGELVQMGNAESKSEKVNKLSHNIFSGTLFRDFGVFKDFYSIWLEYTIV